MGIDDDAAVVSAPSHDLCAWAETIGVMPVRWSHGLGTLNNEGQSSDAGSCIAKTPLRR